MSSPENFTKYFKNTQLLGKGYYLLKISLMYLLYFCSSLGLGMKFSDRAFAWSGVPSPVPKRKKCLFFK
jgi:hypothetical protein